MPIARRLDGKTAEQWEVGQLSGRTSAGNLYSASRGRSASRTELARQVDGTYSRASEEPGRGTTKALGTCGGEENARCECECGHLDRRDQQSR